MKVPDKRWIQTFRGKKVFPLAMSEDMVDLADIAHALANICRYTGHVKSFYSVGQHSVLVSHRAEALAREKYDGDPMCEVLAIYVARWGLLHDASEAYIADIASPLKRQKEFKSYRKAEKKLMDVITSWAGLGTEQPEEVSTADRDLLATEARDLMAPLHPDWLASWPELFDRALPEKVVPLPPAEAEALFWRRARDLELEMCPL